MTAKSNGFYSPTLGSLNHTKLIAAISAFIGDDPSRFYRLVIGSDSQSRRKNKSIEIDYVTAIIVHKVGYGAKYFWRKERKIQEKIILRDKIYTETLMSLKLAESLVPQIRKRISPAKYDLEIHIDVGPLGPTREMIREVVGMVTGNGFVAKTKPEAYVASYVADKHT